jgi:hypothetical protein
MYDDEVADELAHDGARELLERAPVSRLAYNGSDGFPRVIPIGFFFNGEAVVLCTAVTSPKVRALAERPEVALTIDVGDSPADARSLLLRGTATLETVEGIPPEYLAASAKVLNEHELAEFDRAVRGMYDRMVRISVVPTWARFFDFGGGRLPAFLQELADRQR